MKNNTFYRIFTEYRKWRKDWDSLCNRCGKCCYTRYISKTGKVIINYFEPCQFLDEETHLCKVFEDRFRKYARCGKVNMRHSLFNPLMPSDCAYVKTFRLWKK